MEAPEIDEATKAEILRDTGELEEGVAYVRDAETGKFRRVTKDDYETWEREYK